MVKEVNKNIFVNDWDFPREDYHCDDPEKKELTMKLAQLITDSIPRKLKGGMKENHMDFWILDRLLTKDEVRFMLSFEKRRTPYTTAELAKKNHMSEEDTQKVIDHLLWIGIIEQNRDNADQHIQYIIPKWVVGSGEYMVEHPTLCDDHPEVATMFNLAPQEPLELAAKLVPPGGAGIGMHVIPVEKAIETEPTSVSVEYLSHWLKKYDKFCKMVCACRKAQRYRGEGVGDIEGYMCIGVGDIAEFLVESGKDAYYITRDEAMDIIMRAERKGYVHQITNLDGPNRIVGICNCSPGSCYGLRTSQLFNTPNMSRSAYRAHVDAEKCVACGKCVEVCPAGAAKLGQKLCHADGSKVMYPVHELPDDHVWGEDKWDKNYRENNQIQCYDSGTSPCKTACPAHIAVQGYVRMAAEGRYEEAVKLIRQDNPFPAVCGAVCNRRCEDRCTRGLIDHPVAIDEIKKFLAEYERKNPKAFLEPVENPNGEEWKEYPIAVIGAGPAGLTAAWYLRKEGYPVTVFEKESRPGGMLLNGIPNFRLEKNVLESEIDLIRQMGAEILGEGIELRNGWGPKEVIKNDDGTVKSIIFKKCTQVKDADGRFNPQYDENDTIEIPCSHVLMAIGQAAEWGHLLDGTNVVLRRNGTAEADPVTLQTAEPDIFVGGDINHGARFAIDAIADGREGMVSLNRFVHPGQSLTIGRNLRHFIELDRDDIRIDSYDNADRQTPGSRGTVKEAVKSFDDMRLPLTEEQVKAEANRCLKCGATTVDFNKCIGCGLCTTRCEFDAIHLSRDLPHCSDMHTAEEMMDAVKKYAPKRMMRIMKTKLTGHSDYPSEQ